MSVKSLNCLRQKNRRFLWFTKKTFSTFIVKLQWINKCALLLFEVEAPLIFSLKKQFNSVRLPGHLLCTVLKSPHRCLTGCRYGLWLGHSKNLVLCWWSHAFADLEVCFKLLSCWKVKFIFIFRFLAEAVRFFFFIPSTWLKLKFQLNKHFDLGRLVTFSFFFLLGLIFFDLKMLLSWYFLI